MNQAVVIDTKTANSLIEAILDLKSEVKFLRKKLVKTNSLEASTSVAIENLKRGEVTKFTNIDKALSFLHTRVLENKSINN